MVDRNNPAAAENEASRRRFSTKSWHSSETGQRGLLASLYLHGGLGSESQ
jgi:hypothetical protein